MLQHRTSQRNNPNTTNTSQFDSMKFYSDQFGWNLERASASHRGGSERSERRRLNGAAEWSVAVVRRGISSVVRRAVQSAEVSRVTAIVATTIKSAVKAAIVR